MAKADIESAFRLLPVHPASFRLLGFTLGGEFYFDKCLPMGCAISCAYFEAFSTFLEWLLGRQHPEGGRLHYWMTSCLSGRPTPGTAKAY